MTRDNEIGNLLYEAFKRAFSECTDLELLALNTMIEFELRERIERRDEEAAQEPEPAE